MSGLLYEWDGKDYLIQDGGSCCFVYAVANCGIHLGMNIGPDEVDEAIEVSKCLSGSTIDHQVVINLLGVPLIEVQSARTVMQHGGVITIMHPLFSGHFAAVFPGEGPKIVLVNSWMGPPVTDLISKEEIERLTWNSGRHFVLDASAHNVEPEDETE